MPGGRPPTPTNLKVLRGNPGKRPISKDEPQPPTSNGKPVSWLRGRARRLWTRLAPMLKDLRVSTAMDDDALGLLCDAMGEYLEARETVRKEGRTYITYTEAGARLVKPHPEIANASDAWRRVQRMMVEFGMTPSSRTKVKTTGEEEKDPFEVFLSGNSGS